MTFIQIVLIIYLCCFVCSWGGLWLITHDAAKQLYKEGYKGVLNISPFSLYAFLVCACPVFNVIMAISILCYYDIVLEGAKEKVRREKNV